MADEIRGLVVQMSATTALMQSQLREAERSIQQFDKQAEVSTRRVEQNFQRVGRSAGAMRSGFQQLSFQLGDIAQGFAMGTRPMTIFAQQSGQVVQALSLMTGGTGKFLSFLGGPWGLAISAGAVALAPFIAKLFDTGAAADDTKGKVEALSKAVKNFADLGPYVQDALEKQGRVASLQEQFRRFAGGRGTARDLELFGNTSPGKQLLEEIKQAEQAARTAENFVKVYSGRLEKAAEAKPASSAPGSTKTKPAQIKEDADLAIKSVGTLAYELSQLDASSIFKKEQSTILKDIGIDAEAELRKRIDIIDREGQAQYEADEARYSRREIEIRNLARLFEDGFRGGTRAIWRDFKDIGLAVISQVLARFVAGNISGGGGGFNLGSAFSSAIGSIFGGGFANGGNPPVGKISLVGERGPELIMPRTPTTVIPNHAMGGTTIVNDMRGAIVEEKLYDRMQRIAAETTASAAKPIIQAAQTATLRTITRPALGR